MAVRGSNVSAVSQKSKKVASALNTQHTTAWRLYLQVFFSSCFDFCPPYALSLQLLIFVGDFFFAGWLVFGGRGVGWWAGRLWLSWWWSLALGCGGFWLAVFRCDCGWLGVAGWAGFGDWGELWLFCFRFRFFFGYGWDFGGVVSLDLFRSSGN